MTTLLYTWSWLLNGTEMKARKIQGWPCFRPTYSWTSIIRTSIIQISLLSGLFHWSQFGHKNLLVTIKIGSCILFKITALESAVSNARVFCSQRAKAVLALVITNEEHSNKFWLAQSCVVAKWNFTLYGLLGVVCETEASVTNIYSWLSFL